MQDALLQELTARIEAEGATAELLFERGKRYWQLGMRAEAMGDYAASARLKPDGPASRALEQARDVMAFFNPDIFNP